MDSAEKPRKRVKNFKIEIPGEGQVKDNILQLGVQGHHAHLDKTDIANKLLDKLYSESKILILSHECPLVT